MAWYNTYDGQEQEDYNSREHVDQNWLDENGLYQDPQDANFYINKNGERYHINAVKMTGGSDNPVMDNRAVMNNKNVVNTGAVMFTPVTQNVVAPPINQNLNNANTYVNKQQSRDTTQTANQKKDPCSRKSHFYIVDKDGKAPGKEETDRSPRAYFNIINARAGGIFFYCPETGKVLLSEGQNPENVVVSKTVSKILALTVNNGINGGVGYNKGTVAQNVLFKVYVPSDIEKNDEIFIDEFTDGRVDLTDIQNLINKGEPLSPDKGLVDDNAIIQAALLGHHICERYSRREYEDLIPRLQNIKKRNGGTLDDTTKRIVIEPPHKNGMAREMEIINEMTGWREKLVSYDATVVTIGPEKARKPIGRSHLYSIEGKKKYARLVFYVAQTASQKAGVVESAALYKIINQ